MATLYRSGNILMKRMLTYILLIFSINSYAGIQVNATRVIYNSIHQSASLSISNDGDNTYMVQSWLDTGDADQMPQNLPIVVTPPILKLLSKKEAILRFIYSGSGLPQDRESLFWINVQEIPMLSNSKNVLQIAIRTRIKLFYRPNELKTNLKQQATVLKWKHNKDGKLLISNDGPLHITLNKLTLINNTQSWIVNANMVGPYHHIEVSLPKGAEKADIVSFTYINDYGGNTKIENIKIN